MLLAVGTLFPLRFSFLSLMCFEIWSKSQDMHCKLLSCREKTQDNMWVPAQGGAGNSVRCPNTSKQWTPWLSGRESGYITVKLDPGTSYRKSHVSPSSSLVVQLIQCENVEWLGEILVAGWLPCFILEIIGPLKICVRYSERFKCLLSEICLLEIRADLHIIQIEEIST